MSRIIELSPLKGDAERLTKARWGLLNERNQLLARGYIENAYMSALRLEELGIDELLALLPDSVKPRVAEYVEELLSGQNKRSGEK